MYNGYITDIEGIKVGHGSSEGALTGCTVIICEEGATGGVDVRGSAPGTRKRICLRLKTGGQCPCSSPIWRLSLWAGSFI